MIKKAQRTMSRPCTICGKLILKGQWFKYEPNTGTYKHLNCIKAVVVRIRYGGKGLELEKKINQTGKVIAIAGIDNQNVKLRFCDKQEYWFYTNEIEYVKGGRFALERKQTDDT